VPEISPMTRPMTTHATRLPTDLHRATVELNALNEIAGGVGNN
jgi:hypothetical protein